jgi:hypothetical protein
MDKLIRDNEAAELQLAELKAYAEAITAEIVEMVSLLEKTKGDCRSCFPRSCDADGYTALEAERKAKQAAAATPGSVRAGPLQRRATLLSMGEWRGGFA